MKNNIPDRANEKESEKLIFRNLFIDNMENEITDIIWDYYEAVKERWPEAWNNLDKGYILSRSNGFMAHARFMRVAYNRIDKRVPNKEDFLNILNSIEISNEEHTVSNYNPGATGEKRLLDDLENGYCHTRIQK